MSLRPKQSSTPTTTTPAASPPPEGKLTVNEVRQMLDAKARADLSAARVPELSLADMARTLRQAGFIVVEPVGRVPRK